MSAAATSHDSSTLPKSSISKKPKKEKANTAVPASTNTPPSQTTESQHGDDKLNGTDGTNESPYIRDLQKNHRNVNKRLTAMAKVDAIMAENPNLSLDDLVAARKINNDQKVQALNKPHLQAKLVQLEEQIAQYRKFEEDSQQRWNAEKEKIEASHAKELEDLKNNSSTENAASKSKEMREQLLILSKFLGAAAARRQAEDDTSDESKAFEGMLLLIYGGNNVAVDAGEKLLTGSSDFVPSVEGEVLSITYEQVKRMSLEFDPFPAQAQWVDEVARADAAAPNAIALDNSNLASTDPTLANAGLTELNQLSLNNAPVSDQDMAAGQGDIDAGAANIAAAQQWDTTNSSSDPMADSWVSVPRDPTETETGPISNPPNMTQSWADEAPVEPAPVPVVNNNDGFREVHHGRGGRPRGEFRGGQRGRGGMRGGDGHQRGRGGFRGDRGGEGFRGRGRGGRGRGRGEA